MRFITLIPLLLLTAGVPDVTQAQFIVAHRGASWDAPENTLAAFRLAWHQDADAIEGDFRLTRDGHIVCIHDKSTERVAPDKPKLKVADATLDELRALDVGSWKSAQYAQERIPTLTEVLATVPAGRRIFVEIKCGPEILPVLRPVLARSGLQPQQITIICFDRNVVAQTRRMMPQYSVNWLTSYRQKTPSSPWKPSVAEVLRTLEQTEATGLGSQANLKIVDADFVARVRKSGFGFHVWTVNDPAVAETLQAIHVESITTDRPGLIRQALQRH